MSLTARKYKRDWLATSFSAQMNLRAETAAGSPEGLALLASGCTGRMLMGTRAIYKMCAPVQLSMRICISLEFLQYVLPHPGGGPPPEPTPRGCPWTETLRQVPPGGTGPKDPEDRAENYAMVARRATRSRALRWEERSEALPLLVC